MTSWRGKRRDGNEAEIVRALERHGATVERLHGKGVPDLLVGAFGETFLMEVKDPTQEKAGGRQYAARPHGGLNDDQWAWHKRWGGGVCVVVRTTVEALSVLKPPSQPST